jgi:hypothetical protein
LLAVATHDAAAEAYPAMALTRYRLVRTQDLSSARLPVMFD